MRKNMLFRQKTPIKSLSGLRGPRGEIKYTKNAYDKAQSRYEEQAVFMDAIDNAEINLSDAKVKVSKTEKDLAAAKEAYETAKQNAATCNRNLAAAKDKLERAGGLSYVDAYENGVADEDFAFLNEYIMLVKQAEDDQIKQLWLSQRHGKDTPWHTTPISRL